MNSHDPIVGLPNSNFRRHRTVLAAAAASVAVHAAVIVGVPGDVRPPADLDLSSYVVTLEPGAPATEVVNAPAPRPAAKPRAKPRSAPRPGEVLASLAPLPEDAVTKAAPLPDLAEPFAPLAPEEAKPEVLALAEPATPIPALEAPKFPRDGLPSRLSISYSLTSPFADGRAEYTWERDGDRYVITGNAEAVGFFTLFLEGQITQESRGTVGAEGLRPERFIERRPRGPAEGLEFDWANRSITFSREARTRQGPLTDNTVDWLSMIFQLAHVPPRGERTELRVYTQRRLYNFSLKVLGVEELDLPIGKVSALHLRHEGRDPAETVDVWLGIEQHHLPVKLRFPVARNRFQVEQVATSISGR